MSNIDASIPLRVNGFQAPDQGNMLLKFLQLKGLQQEQGLNEMKADEYRRGVGESNALAKLYGAGLDWNDPAKRNEAFAAAPTKATAAYKAHVDAQKDLSEVDKRRFEIAKGGYEQFQQGIGAHFQDPNATKQSVLGTINNLVAAKVLDPGVAVALSNRLPDDPVALKGELRNMVTSRMSPEKMLEVFAPKPTAMDNGAQQSFRDTNPLSQTYGQQTAGGVVQKQATPGEVMTDSRTRSEGAANRGVTMRGQDMTDQRQRDTNAITQGGQVVKTETDLRKEFADLPEVKRYKAAYPSFKAIQDAAKTNNPQADINLIYGLAKLYDPESVVREGEYSTIANSQAIPERVKSWAQSLRGGGKLTPETKRQILEQANQRISAFEGEYQKANSAYGGIAKDRGANTANVIPPVGRVVDFGSLR